MAINGSSSTSTLQFKKLDPCTADATATHYLLLFFPGFTFLVPAHLGSPRHSPEGRKMVVVVVVTLTNSTHTHTHNRFTAGLEYVRVHPGQQVPER